MAPPLALRGTTMYSFLLPADPAALTAICDQQLNAVTGATRVYRPLMPMVAIVCADVSRSYSETPPDSEKGWMGERDFGIWIPVVADHKPAWYLPYVFVDNVAAMVTGREVYGFFKQTAALGMPASPSAPGAFTTDALAIQHFSPESRAEVMRLLTLTSTADRAGRESRWGAAREALDDLRDGLRDLHGQAPVWDWKLVLELLMMVVKGDVPMVFLKQLRDATDPTKACYQAVIEAPAHLEKWHAGGFTHPHDITIADTDSHPIVKECGLGGYSLRSELGFWCQIDFVMKPGVTIAER